MSQAVKLDVLAFEVIYKVHGNEAGRRRSTGLILIDDSVI